MKLPPILARLWNTEFVRFAAVGTVAFVVDTMVLYLALWVGLGLYAGRVVSYLAAATFTWYGNRHITFVDARARARRRSAAEWLRFLLTNLVGGASTMRCTRGWSVIRTRAEYPVLGVAAGAIAGLSVNFTLSKLLVFRGTRRLSNR